MRPPATLKFVCRVALAGAVAAIVSGCSPEVSLHGDLPPPEVMPQVKPNLTRSDILSLLGTPSSVASFDNNTWYYISHTVENYAFFLPKDIERKVLEIRFDKNGTVISVRELGLNDGETVAMVDRQTPAAGRELSVIEQLLGNIGRFGSDAVGNSGRPPGR
jgi:outer membrane protein assembly factor BamE (lipoprotein component of BamABCDE complex)